jgi:hypothetical protein
LIFNNPAVILTLYLLIVFLFYQAARPQTSLKMIPLGHRTSKDVETWQSG